MVVNNFVYGKISVNATLCPEAVECNLWDDILATGINSHQLTDDYNQACEKPEVKGSVHTSIPGTC